MSTIWKKNIHSKTSQSVLIVRLSKRYEMKYIKNNRQMNRYKKKQ
jgi:hypothetical protein